MTLFLTIAQIVCSIFITGAVLLQAQGSGLGSTWAGGGETYHTKRGVERVIFFMTIGAIAIFALLSVVNLIVQHS